MWTSSTESNGTDLPEPNHFVLLVPRVWSTGLRIYDPRTADVEPPIVDPADVDPPFKVVHQPFVQLFSIHAFINNDDCCKQVPLVFCLMSSRRSKDYRVIFTELLKLLAERKLKCRVQNIVCDFEKATWKACKEVFPDVNVLGCFFTGRRRSYANCVLSDYKLPILRTLTYTASVVSC